MSTELESFSVVVEAYAERHYIKEFEKKYGSWKLTWIGLVAILTRFDPSKLGSAVEIITQNADCTKAIYKYEFRIPEQRVSAHASGNRMIICVDHISKSIQVLLVYNKNNVRGSRETDWWQGVIRDNYNYLLS